MDSSQFDKLTQSNGCNIRNVLKFLSCKPSFAESCSLMQNRVSIMETRQFGLNLPIQHSL